MVYIYIYRRYRLISSADTHARTTPVPSRPRPCPNIFVPPLKHVSGDRKTFYDNSLIPPSVYMVCGEEDNILKKKKKYNRLQCREGTTKTIYYHSIVQCK